MFGLISPLVGLWAVRLRDGRSGLVKIASVTVHSSGGYLGMKGGAIGLYGLLSAGVAHHLGHGLQ